MQNENTFKSICDDIELMSVIKTVIYDGDMNIIYSQPDLMSPFCACIRKSDELQKKCFECDRYGFRGCGVNKDIHIYRCHMGLTEAVAPIIENGRPIGYLMLGQLLSENSREQVKQKISRLPDDVDKEKLFGLLGDMNETGEEQIRAAARILAMCACYVRLNSLMKPHSDTLMHSVSKYIYDNLAKRELSVSEVCSAIGMSRTSLYILSKENFGMGIAEYIRKMRIESAIKLLNTTSMSLFSIAERVGISSPEYLIKLIKKHTGMTPKQIRSYKTM